MAIESKKTLSLSVCDTTLPQVSHTLILLSFLTSDDIILCRYRVRNREKKASALCFSRHAEAMSFLNAMMDVFQCVMLRFRVGGS